MRRRSEPAGSAHLRGRPVYCSGDPVNCSDLDGKLWGTIKRAAKGAWNFTRNNPALVLGTISAFSPPPVNLIAGAAAIGFSAYSAYKNVRAGRYGAAAFDVVGAIPGVGGFARGARAAKASYRAYRVSKNTRAFRSVKGYRGARKTKRAYVNEMRGHRATSKRHTQIANKWGKWDRRGAVPVSWSYTACKYHSSCQRRNRWAY